MATASTTVAQPAVTRWGLHWRLSAAGRGTSLWSGVAHASRRTQCLNSCHAQVRVSRALAVRHRRSVCTQGILRWSLWRPRPPDHGGGAADRRAGVRGAADGGGPLDRCRGPPLRAAGDLVAPHVGVPTLVGLAACGRGSAGAGCRLPGGLAGKPTCCLGVRNSSH